MSHDPQHQVPKAVKALLTQTYVDDVVGGAKTPEGDLDLQH